MEDMRSLSTRGRRHRLVPCAVRILAGLLVGHLGHLGHLALALPLALALTLAPTLQAQAQARVPVPDPEALPIYPSGFVGPLPRESISTLHAFDGFMDELSGDEEWYARHAGMVETESSWQIEAESPWAQGWSQFTPPTRGDWWPRVPGCAELVEADPFNQRCNVLAMHLYMEHLHARSLRMVQDERAALAMARRAYNGGLGWQMREHKLCLATPGCDPGNSRHMQALCREAGRSEAACRENYSYAPKIERAEAKYRPRKKKRAALRVLGGIAKTAARTAVAVSPSPVGLDDLQRVRKGAGKGIRAVRAIRDARSRVQDLQRD